jgi:NADPH-dependent glutamate synthase beta subunit-like oxidoreductase
MDQKELRELEKKCIQEEVAECIAACPIHVNARSFIQNVQKGAWNEAWKVLRRTMPFPGILGRICDAPCRKRCKRKEVDEPIEIGALERACVSMPAPKNIIPPLPGKDKKIAVFGSGLSSLTVCWDLAKKGYQITIFEPGNSLGGPLKNMEKELLPLFVTEEETAILAKMGVKIQYNAPALTVEFLGQCMQDSDAIYIGLDAISAGLSGLKTNPDGTLHINDKIQSTGTDGVFAGGCSENSAASVIWQVAEGRWAATSIDRYLQKVSMTAGREKEGPFPTRLYTSTKGIASAPEVAMSHPETGYTENEAIDEARRCILCECLECVKVCPYLEHYRGYPKKYAREIYNNESIVMGARHANKMINSCSLCGLCEHVCPENFAMQDLCLSARRSMVSRDKMPPSAHEFALMDMAFSQGEDFAMARHQPGKSASTYLFFPGCQLCASSPDKVFNTYQFLCTKLSDGMGLMLDCCSAPAHWAGREAQFQENMKSWKQTWIDLGRPELIVACSTCYRIFSDYLQEVPIISLWPLLKKIGLPQSHLPVEQRHLAVHDPCTTRYEPEIQDAVRILLKKSGGIIEELVLSRDLTECCGYGGLMQNADPHIAKEIIQRRAKLSPLDYLTYCGMCRDNLASAGKRVLHILDILFPDPQVADPAAKKRPGWSERRENRARLKDRFKQDLWGEKPVGKKDYEQINIRIAAQVREILEKRRILDEDIQKVIFHAQKGGKTFFNQKTGHFKASFKHSHVTFWVEYSRDENTYDIHNAYSHRMEVIGQ